MTFFAGDATRRFCGSPPRLLVALSLLLSCGTPPRASGLAAAPSAASPSGLRAAYVTARQKAAGADYSLHASEAATRAENAALGASIAFDGDGVHLGEAARSLTLRLRAFGCDGGLEGVITRAPRIADNRASFAHETPAGDLDEWYLNGPLGIEQGFTLSAAVACATQHDLVLEVSAEGLTPRRAEGGSVDFVGRGGSVVYHYTDLHAVDARGRELLGRMEVSDAGVRLVVDARGASYPVVVDPLIWSQQQELLGSDGDTDDNFGYSACVSGDTAIVGAFGHTVGTNDFQGAAYVFVRNGSTWTQQQELTAGDGAANDYFGNAVSVDGDVAVVGAPFKTLGSNGFQGAAYVFVRNGSTWTPQQELTASDGGEGDDFGNAVSVSGNTVLVGANQRTVGSTLAQGAAYVFVRSGTAWTQQQELTAGDGSANDAFGTSLSLDGDVALLGATGKKVGANGSQGAAYVFVRSGTVWTQEQELTAGDGSANDAFGSAVSIEGTTALVGAPSHTVGSVPGQGAAYVFTQSGAAWTPQQELTAVDGAVNDAFGTSLGLDGNTAAVGARFKNVGTRAYEGAAYVFERAGTSWTQEQELTASDGETSDAFGASASVSGNTVLVTAQYHVTGGRAYQGSAYVFTGIVANGTACDAAADCPSGNCVDGVCCDTACGGGSLADCQACSVAHGAARDGTCAVIQAAKSVVCRAAVGTCDAAETCDGVSGSCPPDVKRGDGAACEDGNPCTSGDACLAGTCVAGAPKACAPTNECEAQGACDPETGTCSFAAKEDETLCAGGVCIGGSCTPGATAGTSSASGGGVTSSAQAGSTTSGDAGDDVASWSSCTLASGGGHERPGGQVALALAFAAARLRRRGRRRSV